MSRKDYSKNKKKKSRFSVSIAHRLLGLVFLLLMSTIKKQVALTKFVDVFSVCICSDSTRVMRTKMIDHIE